MKMSGQVPNRTGHIDITGQIASDGTFTGTYGTNAFIKNSGDSFEGSMESYYCGHASINLKRVKSFRVQQLDE